jgi:hypothetical protein
MRRDDAVIYVCAVQSCARSRASKYPDGFYRRLICHERRSFLPRRNRIFPARLFSRRVDNGRVVDTEGSKAPTAAGDIKAADSATRDDTRRVIHSPRVATFFSALTRRSV